VNKKYLFVDLEYCNNCHACEVACKQENDSPVGVNWLQVVSQGPRLVGGKLRTDYIPMRCMNCPTAPCIDVCPTKPKAITQRADGLVIVDPELCIGEICQKCIEACNLGVIQLNPQKDVVEKCNLCVDRVDAGLLPACVAACPPKCMYYGEMSDLTQNIITRLYYFTLLPEFTERRGMRRWQKGDPVGRKLHRFFFGLVRGWLTSKLVASSRRSQLQTMKLETQLEK